MAVGTLCIQGSQLSQSTQYLVDDPQGTSTQLESLPSGIKRHKLQCRLLLPDSPIFTPQPIMKPDIVFFGEGLPDEFHDRMAEDKDECDLLIVVGSSLKVRPVALIPSK